MKTSTSPCLHASGVPSLRGRGFSTLLCIGSLLLATSSALMAAFGVTEDSSYLTVDSGAGLIFKVSKTSGDIRSIKFNGSAELNATSKGSHLSSGLGSATVKYEVASSGAALMISAETSTLTHYMLVKKNVNTIYMATYIISEPSVGELRWITRLQSTYFPNAPQNSDLRGNTGAIESSDVFGFSSGANMGQSRSKYYGNVRAMDLALRGVTGTGLGVFMHYGSRESSSGGPFFRDIQNQTGTDAEVYNYMNSGHNQTETWRTKVLHGPYALIFTNGSTPASLIDYTWISSSGFTIKGWVPNSARGRVVGAATGIPSGFEGVVAFSNSAAQYWCKVSSGRFTSPLMKPGTYTQILYKGELAVAAKTVVVTASAGSTSSDSTVTSDIASTESTGTNLWRIGEWDGTPAGFLNAATIPYMHPSDVRISTWKPGPYVIGTSLPAQFPSCMWKDVNNGQVIKFSLTAEQAKVSHVIKVGCSAGYNGGRFAIKMNSWNSSLPGASSQPSSRSITIGTYRGNNFTNSFTVPASAFVAGENTLTLNVISGTAGTAYLSPGVAIDCVEMN